MIRNSKIHSELFIPKPKKKKRQSKFRKIFVKRKKNRRKESSKMFINYPFLYKIKKWYKSKKKNKKYIIAFVTCKVIISLLFFTLEIVL